MAKTKEKQTLEEVIKSLDKDYGKGSVIGGGELENYTEVISTGSVGLDLALGIGGLPRGKVIEIYGWESSGKSTLTQSIIAEAQKKGIRSLLVDGENSLDENYATTLGVNLNDLLVIQLDEHGGEAAYNKAERLISTGEIGLCIFDSQNSLQPKSVLDADAGDSNIGKHARLMNQVVPKMNRLADQNNCMIIFISQLREKIGVMFGSPETTQGGNALRFYTHVRLDVRKSVLKESDEAYANKTKVKVVKNKMAPPFKVAEFEILYGHGINKEKEVIDIAADLEIIKVWGKTITFGEQKVDCGDDKVKFMQDNPEFYEAIKEKLMEQIKFD